MGYGYGYGEKGELGRYGYWYGYGEVLVKYQIKGLSHEWVNGGGGKGIRKGTRNGSEVLVYTRKVTTERKGREK